MDTDLRGLLGDARDLRADAAKLSGVAEMARAAGAKTFGVNSLVRLQCAGKDQSGLETKTGINEANFYYSDYLQAINSVQHQIRFARAVEIVAKNLSRNNRNDLETSSSTLASDGSLKPIASLMVVPDEAWNFCPVPFSSRLHPALRDFKAFSSLANVFDINEWVIKVADRASSGTASDEELEALYAYLLKNIDMIKRTGTNAVRRSPVIKDREGKWRAPLEMTILPAEQAKTLSGVVMEPSIEVARNDQLSDRLSIRRKLSADDLIALAKAVADDPIKASRCENFIAQNLKLLTPKVVANLRLIPFLLSKANSIAAPEALHLDVPACVLTLDNSGLIVGGRHFALYKGLKIPSRPSFEVIADTLRRLRDSHRAPEHIEAIYAALVFAATSEHKNLVNIRNDAIFWVDGTFHAPSDVLVGHLVPKCLDIALPVVRNRPALEKAYAELGATRQPTEEHWTSFFRWVGMRANKGWHPLKSERALLRQAYAKCFNTGLPKAVDDNVRCLLSHAGTLHTRQELVSAQLLENDYPQLAEALLSQGSRLQFADLSEGGDQFFARSGLQRLTDVCGEPTLNLEQPANAPRWYTAIHESDLLRTIHHPDFAITLYQLAWALNRRAVGFEIPRQTKIARKLNGLAGVVFYFSISLKFTVKGISASVPALSAFSGDRIGLKPCKSKFDYYLAIAPVLAEMAGAVRLAENRALSALIFPLLNCRTGGDMHNYLLSQGIEPSGSAQLEEDTEEQEGERTEAEIVTETILDQIVGGSRPIQLSSTAVTPHTTAPVTVATGASKAAPSMTTLPPLEAVAATVAQRSGKIIAASNSSGGREGAGYGGWSPRTPAEVERDRLVGERGEVLVYNEEIKRLRAMGYPDPETIVVRVSQNDPGSDHDICSVASDGKTLWIEVKATTGTDGRFEWSYGEFQKALREGDHYEVWRIYQAAGAHPVIKKFPNPIALLREGRMRLEVASFRAVVEPKD